MIKKLRRKFVLINMCLVSAVLLIVFTAVCLSTYQRLRHASYDAMKLALSHEVGAKVPRPEIGGRPGNRFPFVAVFCVHLNSDGDIIFLSEENVSVTDETASLAAKEALDSGNKDGILGDMGLRFLMQHTSNGVKIAFADLSGEEESMASLIFTSLLVGLGGLAAFLLISFFLADWALLPVKRAWEQQRQFVADASHELKTPLTVILANIKILLSHRQETVEQQLKWVEYMDFEASRMKTLVDDLLLLAKSDASRNEEYQRVSLSDAVWSSFLPFESVAFEKKVALNSRIEPDVFVTGDESQLKQLTVILLDNALKYAGEHGSVTLSLEKALDRARLSVHNTGNPIEPDHLNNLFERFYRPDDARTRGMGGYGLGLAIARSIVEKHKGKISVESTEKDGTIFSVSFPLEKN